MKNCPICGPHSAPHWHFCRNVTWGHKDGQNYFQLAGCQHARVFVAAPPIPDKERASVEEKWDAEAERLFAEYTTGRAWSEATRKEYAARGKKLPEAAEGWTDVRRAVFRERLWPKPPPTVPTELFNRDREEEPAF